MLLALPQQQSLQERTSWLRFLRTLPVCLHFGYSYIKYKQILRVQPTRCNFFQFIYSCKTLYLFSICVYLTFVCPCIANVLSEYNQQDATFFFNLFIPVRHCTCFGRIFPPSSGAQNCAYSVRHLSDRYCYLLLTWPGYQQVTILVWCTLYVQFWAPDDGGKPRLKCV